MRILDLEFGVCAEKQIKVAILNFRRIGTESVPGSDGLFSAQFLRDLLVLDVQPKRPCGVPLILHHPHENLIASILPGPSDRHRSIFDGDLTPKHAL